MAEKDFEEFEIDGDFETVKEFDGGDYPVLPMGNYILEVTNCYPDTFNGKSAVVVRSTVCEGQETPEAMACVGQNVFQNYFITDKALGRLKNLMVACKAPLDKFRSAALLGAKYRGTITHNASAAGVDQNGKERAARTFANVTKESPYEIEAKTEAPKNNKAPAPVTKPAATQARRA